MSYFDELVARYKNMQYGGLSARNPSAIDNVLRTQQGLLGNSLQFGNNNQTFMENIPTDEQQFIDTPTGRVAQNRFRMGSDGNPIFGVPGQLDADGSVGGAASYDSSIDYGDPGYAGVLPVDPVTGETTTQTTQRQGGGRDARDQGMTTENYNFAGGSCVGGLGSSIFSPFAHFSNASFSRNPQALLPVSASKNNGVPHCAEYFVFTSFALSASFGLVMSKVVIS